MRRNRHHSFLERTFDLLTAAYCNVPAEQMQAGVKLAQTVSVAALKSASDWVFEDHTLVNLVKRDDHTENTVN